MILSGVWQEAETSPIPIQAYFCYSSLTLLQELTEAQLAFVEVRSYPWQVDWHALLTILALQRAGHNVTPATLAACAMPDLSVCLYVDFPRGLWHQNWDVFETQ